MVAVKGDADLAGDMAGDMAGVRAMLSGKRLNCTAVFQGDQLDGPEKVICATAQGNMVSELLFERGFVVENCELVGMSLGPALKNKAKNASICVRAPGMRL